MQNDKIKDAYESQKWERKAGLPNKRYVTDKLVKTYETVKI